MKENGLCTLKVLILRIFSLWTVFDTYRTTTNDIHEIETVLGIEAARQSIINEARNTLENQGLSVDVRHIMLVADIMTSEGEVKSIGRHGISGEKNQAF